MNAYDDADAKVAHVTTAIARLADVVRHCRAAGVDPRFVHAASIRLRRERRRLLAERSDAQRDEQLIRAGWVKNTAGQWALPTTLEEVVAARDARRARKL